MNKITMTLQVDHLILEALKEDISSEDVTTNAVMKEAVKGEVELICKQDGIIAGLEIFERVFKLLDAETEVTFFCKDGDKVTNGQLMGKVTGDIRVLRSNSGYFPEKSSRVRKCVSGIKKEMEGTGCKGQREENRSFTKSVRVLHRYLGKSWQPSTM